MKFLPFFVYNFNKYFNFNRNTLHDRIIINNVLKFEYFTLRYFVLSLSSNIIILKKNENNIITKILRIDISLIKKFHTICISTIKKKEKFV